MTESRIETIVRNAQKKGRAPKTGIPDLPVGRYMIDAMLVLRPTRNTGFGEIPVDWHQIEAFAAVTKRVSETWEMEALFEMCAAYTTALREGADPFCIAPVDRVSSNP